MYVYCTIQFIINKLFIVHKRKESRELVLYLY